MPREFDRVSLLIDLDVDHFDFDHRFLWGPAVFDRPELRFFLHECVHLWQLLGSGYLANLAGDRWHALLEFEATGKIRTPDSRFITVDPEAGFSPRDLSEALCRFWDVHIVGPPELLGEPYPGPRLEPDLVLTASSLDRVAEGLSADAWERLANQRAYSSDQYDRWMLREDRYAEPYRLMLTAGGSRWAASLFPIVGYFALQARDPCRVFVRSLERLNDLQIPERRYITDTWRSIFPTVANSCGAATFESTGMFLTPAAPVVRALASRGHPVYGHYLGLLAMANEYWATDVRLALPGDPEFRQQLATFFLPPVVRFHDGRWTPDSPAAKLGRASNVRGVLPQPDLADESTAIRHRYQAMGKAGLCGAL